MKKRILQFSVLALLLVVACAIPLKTSEAATGTISASPQYVAIPGSLGSTTITWSTSGCGNAAVYVSVDNGPDIAHAGGTSGTTYPDWIQPDVSFTFKLYANTDKTELLDTVTVVGYNYNDGAVGAREKYVHIPVGQATGNAEITWGANGFGTAQVYVSVNDGAEQLMAQSLTGCGNPNWITPGDKFDFNLYSDTAHTNLLDSVTIYGVTVTDASTTVGGITRNFYYKYTGSAYNKPLVVMLHGATGKGEDFFTPPHNIQANYNYKMQDYFVQNGYVVVAPSSRINMNPPSSGPTEDYEFDLRIRWEHETASYASNEDLQFINYIKGTWAPSLSINTGQVFVWGNSSGGFMASRCAQYFTTGLKGVIIIDAGDASQFTPDNDCMIENSDFLDSNNITFSGSHSPVLSITNQYADVWTNGPYGTVDIIRKEVNLHYAAEMIDDVGDSTNWVIPIYMGTLGNHSWGSWGDNYYDEMLCWMTDRKDGSNAEVQGVYWIGGSTNLFSDADKWVGAGGAVAAVPDQNDWVHLTGTCNIKGVANPGYLVLGWTNRYGSNQSGTVYQIQFDDCAIEPVCVVKEALSIGGVVGAAGHYYLYDGLLKNMGTSWNTYVGQREYGRLIQYSSSTAQFRNLHIGDESTAYGYYIMYGGDLETVTMRVGNGGYGSFQQNAGTVYASSYVYVGYAAGASGSRYTMSGGSFYANNLSISSYGSMNIDISAITYFRVAGDKRALLNGYIGNGRIYDSTSGSTIYASYNGTYTYLHN